MRRLVIIIFLFIYSTKYYQFVKSVCPFDDNPCQFGQECEDFGDFKMCFCDDELYQGEFCEIIKNDPCDSESACQPETTERCLTLGGGELDFVCVCKTGWIGPTCRTNEDDCLMLPCENGGKCVDGLDSFSCECLNGFTGPTCGETIDACDFEPCLNGGACSKLDIFGIGSPGFSCTCFPGFTGVSCEIEEILESEESVQSSTWSFEETSGFYDNLTTTEIQITGSSDSLVFVILGGSCIFVIAGIVFIKLKV